MEDDNQDGHHRVRHLQIRDRHRKGQVLREPIQDQGGREASEHMEKGKAIHWRLRYSVSVPSCGKLDKGVHQEESSVGSIIISISRRAGSAGERFSAHFLCEEHFSLREKG